MKSNLKLFMDRLPRRTARGGSGPGEPEGGEPEGEPEGGQPKRRESSSRL
jgi:hypothetical protein